MNLRERLQAEADEVAARMAAFDSEELPDKPALAELIKEARTIRKERLRILELAIDRSNDEPK